MSSFQDETLPFDVLFQKKTLAHCLRNNEVMLQVCGALRPSHFSESSLSRIYGIAERLFSANQQLSTVEVLKNEIRLEMRNENEKQTLYSTVDELMTMQIETGSQYYIDHVLDFAQKQAVKNALSEVIDVLSSTKPIDTIRSIIDKALNVGIKAAGGIDFFKEAPGIKKLLEASAYGRKKIPTGFTKFDEELMGGVLVGEVATLYGAPNAGKSLILVNFGVSAVEAGHDVLHFIVGDMTEVDVMLRYYARFLKAPIRDVHTDKTGLANAWTQYTEVHPGLGRLSLKYFNPRTVNPTMLKSYIHAMMLKREFTPGLIIIDYADELLPTQKCDSSYDSLGNVYSELKTLGQSIGSPIWTASQITRSAFRESKEGKMVDIEAASDSWQKSMKADIVLGINQTSRDKGESECRLYVAKSRRSEANFVIKCRMIKPRMYILEEDIVKISI